MRRINLDYFLLGGGKQAFRKLPNLLRMATYASAEYNELNRHLEVEAKRIGCKPNEIDFDEKNEIYDIAW